jgi:small subunit ribosomal protein S20
VANTPQSKKRIRQNERHRKVNVSLRSMYRTHIKKVVQAIEKGDKELANQAYHKTQSVIDKMVTKHIIHKNKAARHKSRLNARIKKLV